MQIVLARIDDRLIHGQVATGWAKVTGCERIIICDDEIAADSVRSTLIKQAAPPGIRGSVVDIGKAIRVYTNPIYENTKCLLLFTNPQNVLRLVEGGVDVTTINIGGMSFKEGKKQITSAVSVNEQDIASFQSLHQKGIELEIRKISSDKKVLLMDILKYPLTANIQ